MDNVIVNVSTVITKYHLKKLRKYYQLLCRQGVVEQHSFFAELLRLKYKKELHKKYSYEVCYLEVLDFWTYERLSLFFSEQWYSVLFFKIKDEPLYRLEKQASILVSKELAEILEWFFSTPTHFE